MFLKAARHGELDIMRGISANVMCGQEGYFGTSLFQVVLDIDTYTENVKNVYDPEEDSSEIKFEDDDKVIGDFLQSGTAKVVTPQCSTETLTIQNNVSILSRHITQHTDDDYELDFTQAAPDTRQRKDKR
jgi:DNA-directed RNA polymerase II subunit RPB1